MRRWLTPLLLTTGLSLAGCGQAYEHPEFPGLGEDQVAQLRTVRDFRPEARAARQECLGRLVFDVADDLDLEWALSVDSGSMAVTGFPEGITASFFGMPTGFSYDGVRFHVSDAGQAVAEIERERKNFVDRRSRNLESVRERIREYEIELKEARQQNRSGLVSYAERRIQQAKSRVPEYQANEIVNLDLSDSFAYQDHKDAVRLYLYRADRIFRFFRPSRHEETREQVVDAVRDVVSRFRPRALYEVPAEPGVCLPYAFFADDGHGIYFVRTPLRYADSPGVIYTIDTGPVGDGYRPEPGLFRALSYAVMPPSAALGMARREVQRVGPRGAKIGPYSASQAGMSLNVSEPDQAPVRSYSVYTGTDGMDDLQIWPYIVVEMESFTREQHAKLKDDPPRFEESQQRLDALLRNMHLRPTDPPMPELSKLGAD